MASNLGRKLLLKVDGAVVAGLRTRGLSVNKEAIDVTTDDDDGFRKLLSEAGQVSLDMSIDGLTKDAELRAAALTSTSITLTGVTVEYPNGDSLAFDEVMMNSFEESGSYNEAISFTASLQSSGAWTYTPAA